MTPGIRSIVTAGIIDTRSGCVAPDVLSLLEEKWWSPPPPPLCKQDPLHVPSSAAVRLLVCEDCVCLCLPCRSRTLIGSHRLSPGLPCSFPSFSSTVLPETGNVSAVPVKPELHGEPTKAEDSGSMLLAF